MIVIPPKRQPEDRIERMAVSAREAAKMLSISERTLFSLTKSGKIRAKRIGRRLIYPISELERFLGES